MKEIPLTRGMVALIDDEDEELTSNFSWCAAPSGPRFYAQAAIRGNGAKRIRMHRLILGFPIGLVDHINHSTLDNRRANLRSVTYQQNLWNGLPRGNLGVKGVFWDRPRQKFTAQINHNGAHVHIGRFDTIEEAARAYDTVAKELRGDFAWLNFPREKELTHDH